MREAGVLLDVPDLQDPVRVQSVDAPTSLVAHHIDDIVVLERRPGAQVDRLEGLGRRDIVLAELVLTVQVHQLAQRVDSLK